MKTEKFKNPVLLLSTLCLLEILLLSYCKMMFGYYASPLILFFISSAIGIFPLFIFHSKNENTELIALQQKDKHRLLAIGLFLSFFILFLFVPRGGIAGIYKNFLVDYQYSDIIPTIQTMCQRLLNGEPIYVSIEKFGYHLPTTYLPFMWAPYTIAEYFQFDYRWITQIIFLTGIIFVIVNTVSKENKGIFLLILYAFLLLSFVDKNSEVFGWTVEFMNGTYYSLLALSFFIKNKYVKAFILTFCMLSRYSLVVFVPIYFIIEFMENGFKKTAIFALLTFVFILCCLLPLVKNNWIELYNGYQYYSISGIGEWKHTGENNLPIHVFNGNGFVSWIYSFKSGSLEERFQFSKTLHISLVFLVTILLLLAYFRFKQKINYQLFLLCSFKIYLTVFYGFIQVPYTYLFVVPVLYSLALLLLINNMYYNSLSELINDKHE